MSHEPATQENAIRCHEAGARQLIAAASVEATPMELARIVVLRSVFPDRLPVYIASLARIDWRAVATQAARLRTDGMVPVVHIAARRFASVTELRDLLKALSDAGCTDALVIAGGDTTAAGDFASAMDLLSTGLLEHFGFHNIAVGAHPEGNPAASDADTWAALEQKNTYANQSPARFRVVTQFCFESVSVIEWEATARRRGNRLPIEVGIPGLTSMSRLLKYAALCGVATSAGFLRRQSGTALQFARRWHPAEFVKAIAKARAADPANCIQGIHFFPFGALHETIDYVEDAKRASST
jgi:methylenetetrahydrofolate reductase (NADPH)